MTDPLWAKAEQAYQQVSTHNDRVITFTSGSNKVRVFHYVPNDAIMIEVTEGKEGTYAESGIETDV